MPTVYNQDNSNNNSLAVPKNVVVKHQFKPEFSQQQRRGIASGSSNRFRLDYDAQAD